MTKVQAQGASVDLEASTRNLKLGVDTQPSQLTPSFFDSIFNDGMNPFDECFTLNSSGNAALHTTPRNRQNHKFRVERLSTENRTFSHVDADLQELKRQQTSSISPLPSSTPLDDSGPSATKQHSRSPSPAAFPDPFIQTPTTSISPITSPEDLDFTHSESSHDRSGFGSMEGLTYTATVDSIVKDQFIPPIQHDKNASSQPSLHMRRATIHAIPSIETSQIKAASSPGSSEISIMQSLSSVHRHASFSEMPPSSETRASLLNASSRSIATPTKRRKSTAKRNDSATKIKAEEDVAESSNFLSLTASSCKKRKVSGASRMSEDSLEDFEDDEDVENNDDLPLDREGKRARFLERNRIAASKCRKKKKLMNARLEDKSRILQTENRFLNVEKEQLKADICKLKQIVLLHHSCNCEAIQKYLRREAGKFLDEVNADSSSPLPNSSSNNNEKTTDTKREGRVEANWSNQPSQQQQVFGGEFSTFEELENAVLPRSHALMDINDEDFALMFDHIAQ